MRIKMIIIILSILIIHSTAFSSFANKTISTTEKLSQKSVMKKLSQKKLLLQRDDEVILPDVGGDPPDIPEPRPQTW